MRRNLVVQRSFGGESLDKALLQAALFLIVAILAAGIYLVYYAVSHQGLPSTHEEKVLQQARFAYQANPNDASAAADYARVLAAGGKLNEASDVLEQAASIETTMPVPVLTIEMARIEWLRKDGEKALVLLDTAAAECEALRTLRVEHMRDRGLLGEPDMPEVVVMSLLKADILEDLGRPADAIQALTMALQEDPTMADVLTRRGDLYAKTGDPQAARADYEKALSMIPDHEPALRGLESLND